MEDLGQACYIFNFDHDVIIVYRMKVGRVNLEDWPDYQRLVATGQQDRQQVGLILCVQVTWVALGRGKAAAEALQQHRAFCPAKDLDRAVRAALLQREKISILALRPEICLDNQASASLEQGPGKVVE
jgi:hypothetical protein